MSGSRVVSGVAKLRGKRNEFYPTHSRRHSGPFVRTQLQRSGREDADADQVHHQPVGMELRQGPDVAAQAGRKDSGWA